MSSHKLMKTALTVTLAVALALPLVSSPVFAAGTESTTQEAKDCKKGEVFNEKAKKCEKGEQSQLDDKGLLENAKAFAEAERFDEALPLLNRISDRNNPEVLNYLGYVTRNLGDLEGGIGYYEQALALDPDYTLARSYYGQALILKGDRRGAMMQLDEIGNRCGTECPEYVQLAAALLKKSLNRQERITY